MNNATPATLSRGGVLYINDIYVGWKPYIDSWMDKLKANGNENAKNTFYLAISYYLEEAVLEAFLELKTVTLCVIIAYVQTLWCIVDALYNQLSERKDYIALIKGLKAEGKNDGIIIIYEAFFILAFMWSFGAAVDEGKSRLVAC